MIFKFGFPFVAFLTFARLAGAAAPDRVLFIGNSYTGRNSMPKIFESIVASTGKPAPTTKASTPGGKTLDGHLKVPATLKLIDDGNWDVVVLQGQSLEAAMSETSEKMRENFLGGADRLYERIKAKSPKAKIVFYQTWARHTDFWQDSKANRSVGNNPTEMQAFIRKWYRRAATGKKDCVVAPVGDAWELHYQKPGTPRLHDGDNSHPTYSGSYLAALVIYTTIYRPPKLEISYHGSLPDHEAAALQKIATTILASR